MQMGASRKAWRHGPAMAQDTEQMAGEMIQRGTIASVDYDNETCTVTIGDLTTGELPWKSPSVGGVMIWCPPVKDEPATVLAAEGDLENGQVLLGFYSDAFPPPARLPNLVHIKFPDGSTIIYDHAAHAMTLTVADGTLAITASGGVTITAPVAITGDVTITGNVTVSGTVEASTDVIGGGKSLKSHKHSGVTAGAAQTGAPA